MLMTAILHAQSSWWQIATNWIFLFLGSDDFFQPVANCHQLKILIAYIKNHSH